jgi:putative transposase
MHFQCKALASTNIQEVKIKNKKWESYNQSIASLFWAIGYGVWSTGNVTQDMVDEYLEYHRNPLNKDMGIMILE